MRLLYDIGSRVDGFIAHLLVFRSVNVINIRALKSDVDGLNFLQGDITDLDNIPSNSVESLSCLHAMEHVGLGRYGDTVDPLGYVKGIKELIRILRPGGILYFSVPIGRERLEFNGQRVFSPETIIAEFLALELIDFSAVDENGKFIKDASPKDFLDKRRSCGLFALKKTEG